MKHTSLDQECLVGVWPNQSEEGGRGELRHVWHDRTSRAGSAVKVYTRRLQQYCRWESDEANLVPSLPPFGLNHLAVGLHVSVSGHLTTCERGTPCAANLKLKNDTRPCTREEGLFGNSCLRVPKWFDLGLPIETSQLQLAGAANTVDPTKTRKPVSGQQRGPCWEGSTGSLNTTELTPCNRSKSQ